MVRVWGVSWLGGRLSIPPDQVSGDVGLFDKLLELFLAKEGSEEDGSENKR